MLLQQTLFDGPEEVPVQSGVDKQDNDLGDLVPDCIDVHKAVSVSTAITVHHVI